MDLGTHFKPAGLFQNARLSSCHPRVRGKEWNHEKQRQNSGYSEPISLKKFSKRHFRWRGYSQKQIGSNKLSLSYTFDTEKKGIPKSKKRASTKLILSIMTTFFNDIYSHLQHVRQADLFLK